VQISAGTTSVHCRVWIRLGEREADMQTDDVKAFVALACAPMAPMARTAQRAM
jgi:hypothetical protein